MYLKTVLQTLATKKQLEAEDLYKLNEATFNVPEEESIDDKMASKLFAAVEKTVAAYTGGRYDKEDGNFFYDYVALLGTMQNQHFFSKKQHEMMINWLKEALGSEGEKPKGNSKVVARLEEEHRKLLEEMNKLKDLSNAVSTLRSIRLPDAPEGRGKKSGKGDGKKEKKAEPEAPQDDPARKELKAQVNAAGRALAKKKREVIDKHGVEASEALDHEEVQPFLQRLKELKERYNAMKKPEDQTERTYLNIFNHGKCFVINQP